MVYCRDLPDDDELPPDDLEGEEAGALDPPELLEGLTLGVLRGVLLGLLEGDAAGCVVRVGDEAGRAVGCVVRVGVW